MASSLALGEHFEAFVKRQVMSGRYHSATEVIRDGLRLLEDFTNLREERADDLRRMLRETRYRPPPHSADEVFRRLDSKFASMAIRR